MFSKNVTENKTNELNNFENNKILFSIYIFSKFKDMSFFIKTLTVYICNSGKTGHHVRSIH